MLKVAVYAVTKNEVQSAHRFMDSIEKCNLPVYVLDHSMDGTTGILKSRGAHVDTTPITPWTFDAGKNYALSLVPHDVDFVINMDLDECLSDVVTHALSLIESNTDRVCHLYQPDANKSRVREEVRIHRRHGYKWIWPIHEELVFDNPKSEKIQFIDDVLMIHHPVKNRNHTWVNQLIEAVKQYPKSARMRFLCGRDMVQDGRFEEAIGHLEVFVKMRDAFCQEKSYAYTLIAKCHFSLGRESLYMRALEKSTKCALRRESFIELAHAFLLRKVYDKAYEYAARSLDIDHGLFSAHSDPDSWTFKPHEIMSIAAYNMLDNDIAIDCGRKALGYAKRDEDKRRITYNLSQMGAL